MNPLQFNPLDVLLGLFLGAAAVSALWWRNLRGTAPEPPRPDPDTRGFLKLSPEDPADTAHPPPARGGRAERVAELHALEESLDGAMQDALALLKSAFPQSHTAGIFFPGRGEGWYLRVWLSDAESLSPGAVITSQQGLIGRLMKDDAARVFEGDIPSDSTLLHYYQQDEGVRSLLAVPIPAAGTRRGAVFLDSLKPAAFAAEDLPRVEGFARCIGMLAYHAYLAFEYNQHREQLRHFSRYQRRFLENMSLENIVTVVGEYMRESIEADRYLVAAREEPGSDAAQVVAAEGADAERLRGFRFGVGESGLLRLVFEKEQVVNRAMGSGEAVYRMAPQEPQNPAMRSFLSVPVPTDRGVDMALCVESSRPGRFSESYQNLLNTIARAAGFALSRARLYHEKEELANRDGLTGVLNHRAFQERFREELLRAQRAERKVAVLMMDIDYFKRINDTYGHPVGDRVLKEMAQVLSENVRPGDVVARYGGEEFVCMLPGAAPAEAQDMAERIRQTLEAREFDLGHARFRATLSIGGAVFPDHARHNKELLEKADKALYKAKEGGRNQVRMHP